MIRTYVDSSVLIAAAAQRGPLVPESLAILDDPQRRFLASLFVELEVYPAARRNRRTSEVSFFDEFFQDALYPRARDYERCCERVVELLTDYPISPLDALHVAMAIELGADELVTAEKPGKGITKTGLIDVVSLWE